MTETPVRHHAFGEGHKLAYCKTAGKAPGVVFLHGLVSDMTGDKATHLEAHCQVKGHAYLRFDCRGHGQSSSTFTGTTIADWTADAVEALDALTEGPQILVGSSMGGWVALLAALRRPERVAGLIGIAPAPDFTEDMMWASFTEEQRQAIMRDGKVVLPSEYDPEGYVITRALIEAGRENLVLRTPLPLSMPVRILQGQQDGSVPWQTALRLAATLNGDDVTVTLVKDGDHRLSRPQDLDRLTAALDSLLAL